MELGNLLACRGGVAALAAVRAFEGYSRIRMLHNFCAGAAELCTIDGLVITRATRFNTDETSTCFLDTFGWLATSDIVSCQP